VDRVTARRDAPRRIRLALASASGGCSVRELTAATSLHENAVRRTLAALISEGHVCVDRRPAHSRGRPVLQYRLVGPADEPFRAVLPMVLDLLDSSRGAPDAAYATGFERGRSAPVPGSGGAREALVSSLVSFGFSPVERPAADAGQTALDLTACPFRETVTGAANGRQICHLHHGLLAGIAVANSGELDEFVINDPRVTPCRVRFHELANADRTTG
jgi:predicted ArsR family transcriptional regulator